MVLYIVPSVFQVLLPLLALYVLEKEGCECVLNAPEGQVVALKRSFLYSLM